MIKALGRIKRGLVGMRDTFIERVPDLPVKSALKIGTSVQERDILCYPVGTGAKKVLFVSAIHGNEVGTTKLAGSLYQWLVETKGFHKSFTFYVIPCLNPDGQSQALKNPAYFNDGRTGRFNARNVDLNRNFATHTFKKSSHWTHGKNYQELTEVYCGEEGNSEPETKALTEFILSNKIGAYFGFRSAGRDVMGNDTPLAQTLARTFSEATGYRFSGLDEWEKLSQTGTTKEWCDEHEVAYVEVEASVRWGSDWNNQKPGIEACLNLLRTQDI